MNSASYPRHAESRLRESLADSPVVLIQGPRQCGKTTLAQTVGLASNYEYISFDDRATCNAAQADPAGFVGGLPARISRRTAFSITAKRTARKSTSSSSAMQPR